MATFKDSRGDTWDVPFSARQVKRLKDALGIDVDPLGPDFKAELAKITASLAGFVDVLYVCCERQCAERGLTDVDFGERIDLEVFVDAVTAFETAFLNFSLPRAKRGPAAEVLARNRAKLHRSIADGTDKVMTGLASLNGATGWPEARESNPTDSPSAN